MKTIRLLVFLFCLSPAEAALAQEQVSGGMFGARSNADSREQLNFQLALSQALDSELPPALGSLLPRNELQSGGHSSSVAGVVDYTREHGGTQLFLDGSTYFRYAQHLDRVDAGGQSAQIGASVRLPKQGTVRFTQAAAYSPSYLYELFPTSPLAMGEAIPVNPEYHIDTAESYSYNTAGVLAFGSPLRTRLTTRADYRRTQFKKDVVARPNRVRYGTGAEVSRAFSRKAAISAGYDFEAAESGFGMRSKEHRMPISFEYSPPLSVSRRAMVRLEISPSVMQITNPTLGVNDSGSMERLYPLQYEIRVDYPFRLKWRATANYRRGVDHNPVLTDPVVTTGARVEVAGVIGRRFDVSAMAGYADAVSAPSTSVRNLTTQTGEARLRYALSRNFALYSEYLYYYVDLRERAFASGGLPGTYEQHSIRAGVMLFAQPR